MKIRCLNNFMRGSYEMNINDLTGEIIGVVILAYRYLPAISCASGAGRRVSR